MIENKLPSFCWRALLLPEKRQQLKKLITHLRKSGKNAERISLDNFYKPREQLPFWKDGSTNFESIEGLDIEHFHRLMQQLWDAAGSRFSNL